MLQALCFNCDEGEAPVTYHWSFEPSNPSNTLQSSDLASYSSVADNDAVLVIDLQMFASANVEDHYDFTVTGKVFCSSLRWYALQGCQIHLLWKV